MQKTNNVKRVKTAELAININDIAEIASNNINVIQNRDPTGYNSQDSNLPGN